jgi:Tol biopolymer transport system component/LysM repeat protein
MNERDSSERFERIWEESKAGVKSESQELAEPISQVQDTAERIARADYSDESKIRESLREHLLYDEIIVKPGRKPASQVLWGTLRFAAGAAFLLLLVAGFAWSVRNLIPTQGPAGSQLSQQSLPDMETGVISATLSTTTPMPIAALPTATQMLSSQSPVNGMSYVVQAGDTLSYIAYKFGVSLESLLELNSLSIDSTIYVGQILTVGAAQPVAVQPGNGTVNLRSGPGTDYPVVGQVAEGEQVAAMGKSTDGNWLMVESSQVPGGVAWVSAGMVAPVDVPVVQTPPDEDTATPTPFPPPSPVAVSSAVTLTLSSEPLNIEPVDAAGELYFLLRPVSPPVDRQLYHAQTSCLATQISCPASLVSGYPEAEDNPLAWSPDGRQAALVSSTTSQLMLYTPQDQTWSVALAPFNASMSIALWSPDGYWIAASAQGADGKASLLTLIHPNGEMNSVTALTPAAELGAVQVPLGWLSANEVLFMRYQAEPKGQQGEAIEPRLYRLAIDSGEVEELSLSNGWEWLKSYPAPSPDGSRIALTLANSDRSELAVTDLTGTDQMFLGVNGLMPAWSPDGLQLSYLVQQADRTEIYISRWDGADQRKVFEWAATPSFTWSPDSQYLLITAYPGGGASADSERTIFYLYSLSDGKLKEIGLGEDPANSEFLAPAFEPPISP